MPKVYVNMDNFFLKTRMQHVTATYLEEVPGIPSGPSTTFAHLRSLYIRLYKFTSVTNELYGAEHYSRGHKL
jgi:hypothetical protein